MWNGIVQIYVYIYVYVVHSQHRIPSLYFRAHERARACDSSVKRGCLFGRGAKTYFRTTEAEGAAASIPATQTALTAHRRTHSNARSGSSSSRAARLRFVLYMSHCNLHQSCRRALTDDICQCRPCLEFNFPDMARRSRPTKRNAYAAAGQGGWGRVVFCKAR